MSGILSFALKAIATLYRPLGWVLHCTDVDITKERTVAEWARLTAWLIVARGFLFGTIFSALILVYLWHQDRLSEINVMNIFNVYFFTTLALAGPLALIGARYAALDWNAARIREADAAIAQ